MTFNYDTKSGTSLSKDNRSNAGSFSNNTKASTSLSADNRNSAGSMSADGKSFEGITWASDLITWANELRTWGQMVSQLTLDIRN